MASVHVILNFVAIRAVTIWIHVGGGGGDNTTFSSTNTHTKTWLTSGQTMNRLVCDNVSDAARLTSLSTPIMNRLISDTCVFF